MNVLFQIREDYNKNIAGDSIQMLMTKKHLEELGVDVDISCDPNVNLEEYDLVHIFNTVRVKESYGFALNTLKQNKPYVLSTIYWNMGEYIRKANKANLQWWRESNNLRKEVLKNASVLLPNSQIEKTMIKQDFSIDNKFFIVPNGCDKIFYRANPKRFIKRYNVKDFVLCVGRIAYRKNQLALIKALRHTKYTLVLIGPHTNEKYYDMCRKEANSNTIFLDQMKYESLASAYAAAKVHVLPSWFETPGLSNIEAGLAGCNLVITDKGSQKEYFKNYAAYCNPGSTESIRREVVKMYRSRKTKKLSSHILQNYTWNKAAKKTLEAYNYVVSNL